VTFFTLRTTLDMVPVLRRSRNQVDRVDRNRGVEIDRCKGLSQMRIEVPSTHSPLAFSVSRPKTILKRVLCTSRSERG
jgi:hypothetical protein